MHNIKNCESKHALRLLLKPDQAAAALAISPRLLWTLNKSGELPSLRIGRAVRYDPRDLVAWIDRQKSETSQDKTTAEIIKNNA